LATETPERLGLQNVTGVHGVTAEGIEGALGEAQARAGALDASRIRTGSGPGPGASEPGRER